MGIEQDQDVEPAPVEDAARTEPGAGRDASPPPKQDLTDVLASIRQLVTAETAARVGKREQRERSAGFEGVLILTPEMRVDDGAPRNARSGEILTEGMAAPDATVQSAPILDEEALRAVINAIIREELQGELGDRISRNLRKLIRREMGAMLAEERERENA
jgi:hypothetical protein